MELSLKDNLYVLINSVTDFNSVYSAKRHISQCNYDLCNCPITLHFYYTSMSIRQCVGIIGIMSFYF